MPISQEVAEQGAEDDFISEAAAAKILGVKPITMRMWRYRDKQAEDAGDAGRLVKAPPYVRLPTGRIRYSMAQLRAWIRALPTVGSVPVLPDSRAKEHHKHFGTTQPDVTFEARVPVSLPHDDTAAVSV